MEKQAAPSSLFLSSQQKLEEFVDHSEPSIIGFFKQDGSDSTLRDSFVDCSQKLRIKFRFAHTYQTPSSLGQDGILSESFEGDQVWLYQPLRLRSKLDTSALRVVSDNPDGMKEFIEDNFMGLVGIREPTNSKNFDQIARNPQLVFYSKLDWDINLKTTKYWRNRILKIAKNYRDKMRFAMSDSQTYKGELSSKYGIILTDDMQAVIQNNGRKYVMHQEREAKMSAERLNEFVEDFLEGKLKAYLKSELKPLSNSDPVKIVVGDTFEDIVLDKEKDVMVEFYAPWCGHCKSLAPKYEELAKKLENNTDVVIAKMDATANDFPEPFKVEGFPTIYWVPTGSKESPVKYSGGREVDDFLQYIQKHLTVTKENTKEEL